MPVVGAVGNLGVGPKQYCQRPTTAATTAELIITIEKPHLEASISAAQMTLSGERLSAAKPRRCTGNRETQGYRGAVHAGAI